MSNKAYVLTTYNDEYDLITIAIFNGLPTIDKVVPVMEKFYADQRFGTKYDGYVNSHSWNGSVRLRTVGEISWLIVAGIDNRKGGVSTHVYDQSGNNAGHSIFMNEYPLL